MAFYVPLLEYPQTCRRLSLPLRDYLGSVLPGLANFPIDRVAELTPNAWAARTAEIRPRRQPVFV
jgi:hypothetical protein